MQYIDALPQKRFVPNIVIRFMGHYFSQRPVDSGLSVDADKVGLVADLTVNPTRIDPFNASTAISNYSFRLLDHKQVITKLFQGNRSYFQGRLVEIWIGRCGLVENEKMDFSEYLQLPNTYVVKMTNPDNSYSFSTQEAKDRLATGSFNAVAKLNGDIVSGTDVITLQEIPNGWPSTGYAQIDKEFISWSGITDNNLTGCIRGELGTAPASHAAGDTLTLVQIVTDNPINILLMILISGGGGGVYDVLADGCGISESLVDIAQFEEVRDEHFSTRTFRLALGGIENLRRFIEDEILLPLQVRLRSNNNSKIGLATLDRNIFEIDSPEITHADITKAPVMTAEESTIVNRIRIYWDYSDSQKTFGRVSEFVDEESIAEFGRREWKDFQFKGIRSSLGGADMVNAIQLLILGRFSFPRPGITFTAHMTASHAEMGSKANLITTRLPNEEGELNFNSTLEVVQRAINNRTWDVSIAMSFTSFTGIRQCYLSPTDTLVSFSNQNIFEVGAGRGALYRRGWMMRLYDNLNSEYASSQVNEIASISDDELTFVDNWGVTLVPGRHRLVFADYDQVVPQQKKFCFIGYQDQKFDDGRDQYQITFG